MTSCAQKGVKNPQTETNNQTKFPSGQNPDKRVLIIDERPKYIGDNGTIQNFLQNNVKYPQAAINAGRKGTVFINVLIDSLGNVTKAFIGKDTVGYGCGEEALRAVRLMTKWIPTKIKGKGIDCYLRIPVQFGKL